MDNDIPGTAHSESRLREATLWSAPSETSATLETGLDNPGTSVSRETRSTCVGRVLIGVKELCQDNGVDEAVTAEVVGRLAIDLFRRISPI